MLYSDKNNIAFAHYPKTAGTSVSAWFKATFQDAVYLVPNSILKDPNSILKISHSGVKSSIQHLEPNPEWHERLLNKVFENKFEIESPLDNLRIIGVLRDPFDMLVSLYNFWRNTERSNFLEPELPPLIITAREKSFTQFLAMAVGEHPIGTYRDFFDVGGRCWANTRLLAFENLNEALLNVCKEFDLPIPKKKLEHRNPGPDSNHTIHPYLHEAGILINNVEQHFHWYYNDGQKIMASK